MGTGGCHTQPSSFSPAQGRHLWESLSTPFCPSDRKIPKTPECWIVSFYMMAGQQPNRMAYRDLSKGAVAWKGWNPYYSDTALYSVLCLPMPLPASHCREEAAVLIFTENYDDSWSIWLPARGRCAGCGFWEPEVKGVSEPNQAGAEIPGKKCPEFAFHIKSIRSKMSNRLGVISFSWSDVLLSFKSKS